MVRQAGAYGIVIDPAGRLLVLRAANGRFYLPGGRIEPGESARQALIREIAEECGCGAEVGGRIATARQMILDGSVEVEAGYFRARLATDQMAAGHGAAEHELMWLPPHEALARLHRGGDRRAVGLVSNLSPAPLA